MDQPIGAPPTSSASDEDDVPRPGGPLALHAKESGPEIEDEVVPLVSERAEHADSEPKSRSCDLRFCNRALLIRRQHAGRLRAASDDVLPLSTTAMSEKDSANAPRNA
jgi:hypothetical protein